MFQSLLPSLLMFVFTSYSDPASNVRVVPVDQTPDPEYAIVKIQYPEDDELKHSLPIQVQVRVEGYPLGIETEYQRKQEVRASDKGQTIRVMVDDQPYIQLNEDDAPSDAFDNHDAYFRQTVITNIKNNIKPGDHLIRVYCAYSYGEAVRDPDSFNMSTFCFKKQGIEKIDLAAPMVLFNEPTGRFSSKQPVLLDFLTQNAQLSSDGYKIRLSIDGKVVDTLTQSTPYYIYGLSRGNHTLKLELLNRAGKVVNNPFTTPSRTITIY